MSIILFETKTSLVMRVFLKRNVKNLEKSLDSLTNFLGKKTFLSARLLDFVGKQENLLSHIEVVAQRFSMKKVFLKNCKIHRKTPVTEFIFK